MADLVQHVRENPKTAYERSDWPIAPVGWIFIGAFVFLVIAPFVLMWAYPAALMDAGRRLAVEPPAPRLQVDPSADLAKFRAAEGKKLNSYYWVDKPNGVVHIPIDQAMKNLAHQGIAGFPKAAPP